MRRVLGAIPSAVLVIGLVVGGFASTSAAGGDVTLTVEKAVSGPVPPGTTFTVDLNCEQEPETGSTTMTFDERGNPVPAGSNVVTYSVIPPGGFDCTPTEQPGSGATVSYSCSDEGSVECGSAGPQSDPIVVSVTGTGTATVTVANAFSTPTPPPQPTVAPPPPIEAAPAFTG
jgi:Domain of unknown function (DUF5979)